MIRPRPEQTDLATEVAVAILGLQQFVVRALLDDFALRHGGFATHNSHGSCALSHTVCALGAFMQDDDAVGILDGREAVSNDHDGTLQYLAMLLPTQTHALSFWICARGLTPSRANVARAWGLRRLARLRTPKAQRSL